MLRLPAEAIQSFFWLCLMPLPENQEDERSSTSTWSILFFPAVVGGGPCQCQVAATCWHSPEAS
jgi:hypothetical protein